MSFFRRNFHWWLMSIWRYKLKRRKFSIPASFFWSRNAGMKIVNGTWSWFAACMSFFISLMQYKQSVGYTVWICARKKHVGSPQKKNNILTSSEWPFSYIMTFQHSYCSDSREKYWKDLTLCLVLGSDNHYIGEAHFLIFYPALAVPNIMLNSANFKWE